MRGGFTSFRRTGFLLGSYRVRLGPQGLPYPILRRLCIQMAARSGSAPRSPVSALDERASRKSVQPVPGDGRPLCRGPPAARSLTQKPPDSSAARVKWTTLLSYSVHNDRFCRRGQEEVWRICEGLPEALLQLPAIALGATTVEQRENIWIANGEAESIPSNAVKGSAGAGCFMLRAAVCCGAATIGRCRKSRSIPHALAA